MSEKTATFVRDIEGFRGHASLYRLDPPYVHYWDEELKTGKVVARFVIASSVYATLGHETLVFYASEDGEVLSWVEIGGGYGATHASAIKEMGYTVDKCSVPQNKPYDEITTLLKTTNEYMADLSSDDVEDAVIVQELPPASSEE